MDLLTATNHQGAYEWAAVLLAHFALGCGLFAVVAWLVGDFLDGLFIVATGYPLIWEGFVQRLGAGFVDAAVDTFAVTAGAVFAWAAWEHRHGILAGILVAVAIVLPIGIRKRK